MHDHKVYYATPTEAINELRDKGYNLDFHIKGNHLISNEEEYDANNFDIGDVYRYEGESDPGDETTVYAICSKNGHKGVLVMAYGAYSDEISPEIMKKLTFKGEN